MNDVGARTSRSGAEASRVGASPGPTGGRSASADADEPDRDALEEEREFLLRSLDDLDAEHADGNVDDENYARLHADYTARAARVIHALDGEVVEPVAEAPPVSPRRRVLTVVGIVAFALIAGVALAYGLGARLPGQTITGNQAVNTQPSAKEEVARLKATVRAKPDDVAARLDLARAYMGTQQGADALAQFQAAARLDPTNPEPFAYSGWLVRLQGFPDQGLTLIDKAITLGPEYPDARFFKGVILFRDKSQPDAAIAEFQRYLVAAPDSPLAPQVRQLLAQAVEAGDVGVVDLDHDTPHHIQSLRGISVPEAPEYQIDGSKIYRTTITTNRGTIVMDLDPQLAANTVNNFVGLARQGYYDGLTFHRVVPEFVVQGGCPEGTGRGGPGYQFRDEDVVGEYTLGAVAMANAGPNTNGSQFFITIDDCTRKLTKDYNLFGYVVDGIAVAQATEVGDVMESVVVEERDR